MIIERILLMKNECISKRYQPYIVVLNEKSMKLLYHDLLILDRVGTLSQAATWDDLRCGTIHGLIICMDVEEPDITLIHREQKRRSNEL